MNINPLNVLDMRRLYFIPPHFSCITFIIYGWHDTTIKKIDQWVFENLNSRYCLKTIQKLDAQRAIQLKLVLGVEDSKELTMFSLKCPYIEYDKLEKK
jgi:hypothetical protein